MVSDEELMEIRKRKLLELQKKLTSSNQQEEEEKQVEEQLKKMELVVKSFLDSKAKERLSNIKLAHPDKYLKVLSLLYQNIALGRIRNKLSDEEFKKILKILFSNKRKTKIKFVHEYEP